MVNTCDDGDRREGTLKRLATPTCTDITVITLITVITDVTTL